MAMAIRSCTLSFLIVISMGSMWLSNAHTFYAGGDDGWTLKPSENYSHWAERNRFQINDSIVFKYKKGHDSVLIVNENGYNKCNKDSPFESYKDGNSTFKFDKSGAYYFISGHEQNCEKGQKFIVVVLSDHHNNTKTTTLIPPSTSPSPTPTPTPSSHSPSPSPIPTQLSPHSNSMSPSPIVKTPSNSPIVSPTQSPSPSPRSELVPIQAPAHLLTPSPSPTANPPNDTPVEPPSNVAHSSLPSPKNSSDGSLQPDVQHNAPAPYVHSIASAPHHAPAPAPSAAPFVVPSVGLVAYTLMFSTLVSIVYR